MKKTNTIWFHLYMELKNKTKQMNKQKNKKQNQTNKYREQTDGFQKGESEKMGKMGEG